MGKVIVRGVEYPLPESLTLGEAADVERIVGDAPKAGSAMLLGLVYTAMRRRNPQVTLEQVRALDMESVEVIEEEDASPPAEGAEEAPASESETTPDAPGLPPSDTSSD